MKRKGPKIMDKEWAERDKGFKWFYNNLTSLYKGKHFDPTPGIAGYINDKIVTPMHLRRMDEAYYEHLKENNESRMLPAEIPGILQKPLLANQHICPATLWKAT